MSITRRRFLAQVGLGMGALAIPYALRGNDFRTQEKLPAIGFIEGMLQEELKADWQSALREARALGYTEMEIGKHFGDSVPAFIRFCDSIGMRIAGAALSMTKDQSVITKRLDRLEQLKVSYAIAYWPWFVGGPFTIDDCKKSVDGLNRLGEACRKRNISFCWHNHDKELIPFAQGDDLPFDYIMKHTDTELVKCEMDVYWIKKGGGDPLALLKKYAGRYQSLHVKDINQEGGFECPGSGIMDFKSILAEATKQGVKHFIVEHDEVKDGMACLEKSSKYLKSLTF